MVCSFSLDRWGQDKSTLLTSQTSHFNRRNRLHWRRIYHICSSSISSQSCITKPTRKFRIWWSGWYWLSIKWITGRYTGFLIWKFEVCECEFAIIKQPELGAIIMIFNAITISLKIDYKNHKTTKPVISYLKVIFGPNSEVL